MPTRTEWALAIIVAGALLGCSKEEEAKPSAPPPSAVAKPALSVPAPAPTPSALPPREDCPKGSSGPGTFDKPCEATGKDVRMMQVEWTGKTDDKGPSFRVTNKAPLVVLYGKIVVYFYDKDGKQIEIKDSSSSKPKRFRTCSGNIFAGVMKPDEKAVITFSCVKQDHVPEGTTAIEAEIPMVGFADADGKRSEFYWRNNDLVPDERPKLGKAGAKKSK